MKTTLTALAVALGLAGASVAPSVHAQDDDYWRYHDDYRRYPSQYHDYYRYHGDGYGWRQPWRYEHRYEWRDDGNYWRSHRYCYWRWGHRICRWDRY